MGVGVSAVMVTMIIGLFRLNWNLFPKRLWGEGQEKRWERKHWNCILSAPVNGWVRAGAYALLLEIINNVLKDDPTEL